MADFVKVRNRSGESRFIPALGIAVDVDEVFEVPDSLAESLVCAPIWELVGATTKKAAAPAPEPVVVADPPAPVDPAQAPVAPTE